MIGHHFRLVSRWIALVTTKLKEVMKYSRRVGKSALRKLI